MIRLFGLFAEQGLGPPTTDKFAWFYSMKSNKGDEGFYYLSKRLAKGLHAVVKIRDNMGAWKESYFYILEVQVRGTSGSVRKYPPRISLSLACL